MTTQTAQPFLESASVTGVIRFFGKHAKHLMLSAVVGTVALVTAWVMFPRWTAETTFLVRGGGGQSQVALFANRFGLDLGVGSGGASQGPELYRRLVTSRAVLEPVVLLPTADRHGVVASLLERAQLGDSGSDDHRRRAVELLLRKLNPSVDGASGVLVVSLTDSDPVLAENLLAAIIRELDNVSTTLRQNVARTEREFLETRLGEAQNALARAESDIELFLRGNRVISEFSDAASEYARLQREATMRSSVVGSIRQQLEQARMDALRDTPVLDLIDRPEGSVRRVGSWKVALLLGLVGGMGVYTAALSAVNYLRWERARDVIVRSGSV